ALRVPHRREAAQVTPGRPPVFEDPNRMRLALLSLLALLGCATASSGSSAPIEVATPSRPRDPLALPAVRWTTEEQAVHVLDRLAYGPSPEDLRRVEDVGPAAWIAGQLHPADIDDGAVEKRLSDFASLRMSTRELIESYPRAKKVAEAKGVMLE